MIKVVNFMYMYFATIFFFFLISGLYLGSRVSQLIHKPNRLQIPVLVALAIQKVLIEGILIFHTRQ